MYLCTRYVLYEVHMDVIANSETELWTTRVAQPAKRKLLVPVYDTRMTQRKT